MKIIFVGTGSGKISLNRFHSSFIIDTGNYRLLMDAGDGAAKALLSLDIDVNSIDAILFSHMHPDHSAGFPSLLVQMKMKQRNKDLNVYCHPLHRSNLEALLNYTFILPQRLPFRMNFINYQTDSVTEAGVKFKAALNSHHDELKDDLLPGKKAVSCSFMFYLDKNIFYTADIAELSDLYLFKDEKTDIMIAESTHAELPEIISAFKEKSAEKLYLTHIPQDNDIETGIDDGSVVSVRDGYIIEL